MKYHLACLLLLLTAIFMQSAVFAQPDAKLHGQVSAPAPNRVPQAMTDGLAQLNAGQYPAALSNFAAAIKQRPGDVQARYCFAVTLHYVGDLDDAKKFYQWVVDNSHDEALVRRARKGIAGCSDGVSPTGLTYSRARVPSSRTVAKTFTSAQNMPQRRLASGKKGVIIDVYADWCGWSTRFVPVFEHARDAYGSTIDFARIDAEAPASAEFCAKYQISGYPNTLIFDQYGNLIDEIDGYCPYDVLEEHILAAYPFLKKNVVKY